MKNLLQVNHLTKKFVQSRNFWGTPTSFVHALTDVSLTINHSEIVGLVGESGCGKSTLGRSILQLIKPDSGSIFFENSDLTKLNEKQLRPYRKNFQMIFQDPFASLNPRMTIGDTLLEPLQIHRIGSSSDRQKRVNELLSQVGLPQNILQKYPHEFSGGQRQRIGIARALALRPKLIVADEPVSALDVSIQAQIVNLLSDLQKEYGLSLLFIAHDLKVVEHLSKKIVVMYLGKVMEVLPEHGLHQAKHPYTLSLIDAIPIPDPVKKREHKKEKLILAGDPPSPINPPEGCVFNTRCPKADFQCKKVVPPLIKISETQEVACHFVK